MSKHHIMNENNIITYSFMSALLSGGGDIYSYVYLPLAKRAVNSEAASGKNQISSDELAYAMSQFYGLNIPESISKKLLKLIYKDASRKQKANFGLTFDERLCILKFDNYSYSDKEEIYEKERRNVNKLQDEFESFLKKEADDKTVYPSFSDFIDQNKKSLSAFFSGKKNNVQDSVDVSFLPHAQFLQYIERCDHTLFTTAKNIYLGTLMATFLEDDIDVEIKIQPQTRYFFDTQLILEAIDLQDKDRTKPINDLIKLIRQSNGVICILDVTLDEIRNILKTSIQKFSTEGSDMIVDACKRRNKNLQWLNKLTSNLEKRIKSELDIDVVTCANAEKEQFLKTDEFKKLSQKWARGNRAKHDAIAYLYVRARRQNDASSIQKVGYWFVTANEELYTFNTEERPDVGFPEISTPGFLTGILFLANPSKTVNSVSHLMLSESIAQVFTAESPSIDLINEFEKTVSDLEVISSDEYQLLRDALSLKSSRTLKLYLNDKDKLPEITKTMVNQANKRKEELDTLRKGLRKQYIKSNILYTIIAVALGIIVYLLYHILGTPSYCDIITIVVSTISIIILIWFRNIIKSWCKKILAAISSLGPLWGFGNFAINFLKSLNFQNLISKLWDIVKGCF